jgi:Beta protein
MTSGILYTPILKGKVNDLKALGKVPRALTSHVFPLVEMLSPNDGEHVESASVRFAGQIRKHCPLQVISVDLHSIAPDQQMRDGSPALESLCANLRGLGVAFVPVFGFDHEPELWDRIARIAVQQGRGLTVRLRREDIEAGDDTIAELIDRIQSAGIPAASTNILVDLSSVADAASGELVGLRERTQDFVDSALSSSGFGVVSVVASSMPSDVSGVPKEGLKAFFRNEVPLWLETAANMPNARIAFGDYGIIHPNFSDKNPATNANAKIRYTTGLRHQVFRGHSLRQGLGFRQYHDLSRRVVAESFYLGAGYSFGDDYVYRSANFEVGTGNLGTWVEVDMNHHLVYVSAQLPQLLARLAAGVKANEVIATVT